MPPSRKSKSAKSQEKRGERTSPRKRNVPKVSESTPIENKNKESKTPKRSRRARSKAVPPVVESTPSTSFDCTPSTSYAPNSRSTRKDANEEIPCAFYKVTKGGDGKQIFSKALLKYFMTIDSPEMDDLKNKRFNTSFLHETPRQRNIQIYTEEEDKDPKWSENLPELNFDMPEVPGSEHTHIFESIPVGDSDEEFKRFVKGGGHNKNTTTGRRRSSRVTAFKGKPLPEQALAVDYSGVLDSESSRDRDRDGDDEFEGIEMENEEADIVEVSRHAAVSENKDSILLSLLSAPPNGAGRPYTYSSFLPSICADIFRKKEDEMLLNKYRDVMGNRQVNVVLTRLPIDDKLFKLCGGKKKVLEAKKPVNKSLKGPRLGLSKLQKKKRGGHTKF